MFKKFLIIVKHQNALIHFSSFIEPYFSVSEILYPVIMFRNPVIIFTPIITAPYLMTLSKLIKTYELNLILPVTIAYAHIIKAVAKPILTAASVYSSFFDHLFLPFIHNRPMHTPNNEVNKKLITNLPV